MDDAALSAAKDIAYSDPLERILSYNLAYQTTVSDAQGSFVLRQLIAKEIDGKAKVRKRLISAILLGGNVVIAGRSARRHARSGSPSARK